MKSQNHYEEYESAYEAIQREKQIKNWKRKWKEDLIEKNNPHYADLSKDWFEDSDSGSRQTCLPAGRGGQASPE